jgi:hypothetical protein
MPKQKCPRCGTVFEVAVATPGALCITCGVEREQDREPGAESRPTRPWRIIRKPE